MFRIPSAFAPLLPGRDVRRTVHDVLTGDSATLFRSDAEDRLFIPIADDPVSDRTGDAATQEGRHLARQERWQDLARSIRRADTARDKAACGTPIAELLAYGARSDVVHAVEHALSKGAATKDQVLLGGISALEDVLAEHPGDPMIALIVALAHVDIAWAWHGTERRAADPHLMRARWDAHFDRAAAILYADSDFNVESPILTSARCAVLAGGRVDRRKVADDYEALVALDPENPRHMRAMGHHLLPCWYGSYDELELEARRMASLTHRTWGAGGYAWVQFDAIAQDDAACARVDVDFFLDGLRDIVARNPGQRTINMLAAYCAVTLGNGAGPHDAAPENRARIRAAADWLIRDHLAELHPLIWAHAATGFNNSAPTGTPERFNAKGRKQALRAIAHQFRHELREGRRVVFTPSGLHLSAPGSRTMPAENH